MASYTHYSTPMTAVATLSGRCLNNYVISERIEGHGSISARCVPGYVGRGTLEAEGTIYAEFQRDFTKQLWATRTSRQWANWVAWSKIGEASFEMDLVNDAGYAPMQWQGWVYQIKPLGKNFVVYGEGGITLMYPVDKPSPTFGFQELAHYGVLAKDLVAGNKQTHYFVSSRGKLCKVTEQGLEVLGYEEFLLPLATAGKRPVMFFDELHQRLYINNSLVGYCYDGKALGGGLLYLTSLNHDDVDVVGTVTSTSACGALDLETHLIDLGSRSEKILKSVMVSTDLSLMSYLQVRVGYRVDARLSLTYTEWKSVNTKGEAFFNVTGVDFTLCVKSTTEVEGQIDDLLGEFLVPDYIQPQGEAR